MSLPMSQIWCNVRAFWKDFLYTCLHLVDFYGKCGEIYHKCMLWDTETKWLTLPFFMIRFTSTMIHHQLKQKNRRLNFVPRIPSKANFVAFCGCSVERWVNLIKDNANSLTGFGFDNINIFPWVLQLFSCPPKNPNTWEILRTPKKIFT